MHAWETLNLYCLYDEDFFETSERYAPDANHLAVYRALMPQTWGLRRRGLWFIADPPRDARPMAGQGWKLHVSAPADSTVDVLRRAIPVLRDRNIHFKFLLDPRSNHITSRKSWPRGSSGKFITVYPAADEFEAIGDALTAALDGIVGPYILSDRRYKASKAVYYRYGGFIGVSEIGPEGTKSLMIAKPDGELVPDIRHPYPHIPDWVSEPFAPAPSGEDTGGPLGGRFTVNAAITFTNAGGVYRGTDAQDGGEVVVKEARPHVLTGATGAQTIDVLEKEYEILRALQDTGYYVKPLAFLREWEHAFLVEEYLDGDHLGAWSIANNPICHQDLSAGALRSYYERARELWRQVACAVAAAHDRGILLGDLSFGNVMVVEDGTRVQLIDLEAAVREGVDAELGIYTIGLASPQTIATGRYDRANDLHALGSLMLGSIMVVNNAVGFHRPALERFLSALGSDLGLPAELLDLIADLTSATEHDAHAVLARIEALDFADPRLWSEPPPLALPAPAAPMPGSDEHVRVRGVVDCVARRILETADPQRTDRLFPADVIAFETNPLSVAHGALGVLRALQRMTGEVPSELLGWALREDVDSGHYAPGLHVGQAGIAWAFAELGHADVARTLLDRAGAHDLLLSRADISRGAAGYGMARLRLWQLDGDAWHLDEARAIGVHLASTATRDERGACWPVVGHDGETRTPVGYAYGASGIALFLLYLHQATGDASFSALGRAALDFDLAQGVGVNDSTRAYPSYASDAPEDSSVLRNYWEEGTAGVTTTALRYLAVRPDDADLRAAVAENLADSCRKYTNMPMLFHGLAGLGNVLLDAYEFTGEPRWLDEAWRAGEGVLHFAVDRPGGGVAFPGEQALRESADFATGSAGVGLFLQRLTGAAPGARTNFNFVLDELLPAGTVAAVADATAAQELVVA
jgi:hypothetical protein